MIPHDSTPKNFIYRGINNNPIIEPQKLPAKFAIIFFLRGVIFI